MKKIMMLVSMFIMMCSVNSYAGPGEDDGKMKVSISCGCGAVINITVGSSADSVERVDVGCGTDEVVEPVVSHAQPVVVTPVVRHTPPPAIVVDPVVTPVAKIATTHRMDSPSDAEPAKKPKQPKQ